MAKLAPNPYFVVYSLPQEDHDDTDDASPSEVYAIFVSESSVYRIQSLGSDSSKLASAFAAVLWSLA